MAAYCNKCRQPYPEELVGCPRCSGRGSSFWGGARMAALQPLSDARIDLGSPVERGLGTMVPPSGASFVSWTVLLDRRKKTLDQAPPSVWLNAQNARYAVALLVGFALGCLVCLCLSAIGWAFAVH
jgi:hypothetical protein